MSEDVGMTNFALFASTTDATSSFFQIWAFSSKYLFAASASFCIAVASALARRIFACASPSALKISALLRPSASRI